jgi:hypothetical protein
MLIPIMPIFDWIYPWNEAAVAFKKENSNAVRWMVGIEYTKKNYNNNVIYYKYQRTYIALPNVFTDPATYEFTEGMRSTAVLRRNSYGVFNYIAIYSGLICFSWFVSRPRIKKLLTRHQNPTSQP